MTISDSLKEGLVRNEENKHKQYLTKSREVTVTKADLVEKVAEKTGLTRTDVAVVVDSFLDTVKKAVENGHNIEIRGFGTFKIKLRKARKARNPRTGDVVPVPDRKVPVFKPSNEFKSMITKLSL